MARHHFEAESSLQMSPAMKLCHCLWCAQIKVKARGKFGWFTYTGQFLLVNQWKMQLSWFIEFDPSQFSLQRDFFLCSTRDTQVLLLKKKLGLLVPYRTNNPPTRGVPGTTSLCRPQNRANIEKSEIQDPGGAAN